MQWYSKDGTCKVKITPFTKGAKNLKIRKAGNRLAISCVDARGTCDRSAKANVHYVIYSEQSSVAMMTMLTQQWIK